MAQEPPPGEVRGYPGPVLERRRVLQAVRSEAARDPRLSVEVIRDYQVFLRRTQFSDVGGPRGFVELVDRERRLIVVGHVAAMTEQLDRVLPALEWAGASIEHVEDDPEIAVSLISVNGLAPEALYRAVADIAGSLGDDRGPLSVGLDDVTYQNIVIKPVTPQGMTGGAARFSYAAERPRGVAPGLGAGITVGVIDGGFEAEGAPPRTDGWFDNVVPPSEGSPPLNQVDSSRLDPGAGHGSFVTGIVVSQAPDVTVRQYRATDSYGFGSAWRLKDQIRQAVKDGCQILNISLGFEDPDLLGSPALSAALHLVPSEVIVVASAGNGGTSTPMLPASHKVVVGVGGLEDDLDPVGWSNHGPWVDFSALAIPVVSTYVVDPNHPDPDPNPFAVWAGTSFSAPKVTGRLAALLGDRLTPSEAISRLREEARAARPTPNPDFGDLLDLPDLF